MKHNNPQFEELLTPAEVASMFRVDPKTVLRWADAGKLTSTRTMGGHRRYLASEVRAFLHPEGRIAPDPDGFAWTATCGHTGSAEHRSKAAGDMATHESWCGGAR